MKNSENNGGLLTFFLVGDEEMKSEKSRGILENNILGNEFFSSISCTSILNLQSVPRLMAKVQNISDGNGGRAAGDKD